MRGPPLGPAEEDITCPKEVAPRGRKASSTRNLKPQTSNRTFEVLDDSVELRSCLELLLSGIP